MAGLVGYASSGDETDEDGPGEAVANSDHNHKTAESSQPNSVPLPLKPTLLHDVPLGPSRPPEIPLPADESGHQIDERDALDTNLEKTTSDGGDGLSESPYAAERALVRDLTLPRVANLSMPPSPAASPPRETTRRFAQLLELKQRGVHFNQRLARSAAAANPGIMDSLLEFVGLGAQDQYASALPPELWDPAGLPAWAFREPLRAAQERVRRLREATRTEIEFVPASGNATG